MDFLGKNRDSCALSPLYNAENRMSIATLVLSIFVFEVEVVYRKIHEIT